MPLTEQQKREFRSRGHHLKPVVTIGNARIARPVRPSQTGGAAIPL
mgnify:CR=1 FL=1